MEFEPDSDIKIILPQKEYQAIIDHCRNNLPGTNSRKEFRAKKAFGLLAGEKAGNTITVKYCFPLDKNARFNESYKNFMDKIMAEHAIPSETPFAKRGWVADPEELHEKIVQCHNMDLTMIGTYHMHRVAWKHDSLRDTPTELDVILAKKSRMLMFIVSMVDPEKPIIRAFYEGILDFEVSIVFND